MNGLEKEHLVIIGFDDIVADKYMVPIDKAIKAGKIDGYSIFDLLSEKKEILKRIDKVNVKPEYIYFLNNQYTEDNNWANPKEFGPLLQKILREKGKIKVYIATELKAHEAYLRYCIENEIPSLTEKPIFAPIVENRFKPELIDEILYELLEKSNKSDVKHSIMTLSRYHNIYNKIVLNELKDKVIKYQAPITSFHFKHAGGVWNFHSEYETRDDHPYKQGYGMLMHGGYHYIDLVAQFLELNKLIFPNDEFEMGISSFAAYPSDQNDRISKKISSKLEDNCPSWASEGQNKVKYGETDITSTFYLKNLTTDRVITLGTLAFEQTTPSIRTWKTIPDSIYNKNGRISNVDFEAQLSTLHTVNVQCFDVPIQGNNEVDRIDACAKISTRSNGSLLQELEYNTSDTYTGLFHSDSNRELMTNWLMDTENISLLNNHVTTMLLSQALAISIKKPGESLKFNPFSSISNKEFYEILRT